MITLTSPVTGGAITGFTAPTYTAGVDVPPNAYSKQWALSSIGGTQAGVDTTATASRPWTFTAYKPQNVRILNTVDGNNVLRAVPLNVYGMRTRKGVTPLAGQASRISFALSEFGVPAGSDLADQPNLKALVSSHVGWQNQQCDGIANTLITANL